MFGGNANWRGPIWLSMNLLIIRALLNVYLYYGNSFRVEFPTGSHRLMNFFEISQNIAHRLTGIFERNQDGRRPIYGSYGKFKDDPHWSNYLNFFEYFNAETGAGLGASHHTGSTGLVAALIHLFGRLDSKTLLETGRPGLWHPELASKL
jgi:hypothetical protein